LVRGKAFSFQGGYSSLIRKSDIRIGPRGSFKRGRKRRKKKMINMTKHRRRAGKIRKIFSEKEGDRAPIKYLSLESGRIGHPIERLW
jgi:hypothetical protein